MEPFEHIKLHKLFVVIMALAIVSIIGVVVSTYLITPTKVSRNHTSDETKKSLGNEDKELDPAMIESWRKICLVPDNGYHCCSRGPVFCARTVSPQYKR